MAWGFSFGVIASAMSPDARAAANAARQSGFAGLLFDAVTPSLDLTSLSSTGRREFRHVLKQQDQQLIGLRGQTGSQGLLPGSDIDQTIWRLDQILKAAADLAAPMVGLDLGPLPPSRELPQIIPPLADLGQRADRYGVIVAMRSESAGMEAVAGAIALAACPWFGMDFDPLAAASAGAIDRAVAKSAGQIRHVRGRDGAAGNDRRARPAAVGYGSIDWPQLLRSLDDSQYHGWITLEAPDPAAGLDYLRKIPA